MNKVEIVLQGDFSFDKKVRQQNQNPASQHTLKMKKVSCVLSLIYMETVPHPTENLVFPSDVIDTISSKWNGRTQSFLEH